MNINLIEALTCTSKIIDMVNPRLNLHHIRTAFIAWHIAKESFFSLAQCRKTFLAALLHDIGGLSVESRLEPLNYYDNELNSHALIGGELLATIPLLEPLHSIVRYHHTRWDNGKGQIIDGECVPEESHIIFLADRIDVLMTDYRADNILLMKDVLTETIIDGTHSLYKPKYVEAFKKISRHEHFWLLMQSTNDQDYIREIPRIYHESISLHNFRDIASLLAFVIDGFSCHCVHHSLVVGRISGYLARESGLTPVQCLKVEIGGLLHNLACLDRYLLPSHAGAGNIFWEVLHPIEEIRDIAGWCQLQKTTDEKSFWPTEVNILKASDYLASLLESVTRLTEFQAHLGKDLNMTPELARTIRQRSGVLWGIFQESVRERRKLVKRIHELNRH